MKSGESQEMNNWKIPTIFVTLLKIVTLVSGNTVYDVHLKQGHPMKLQNPEYPGGPMAYETTIEWNLQVEPDSNIKLYCSDLRMGQNKPIDEECTYVHISVNDGQNEKKLCGRTKGGFYMMSQSSMLTVKLVSSEHGSGFFSCTAQNTREPDEKEIVELYEAQRVHELELSPVFAPYFDKVWLFQSPPGTRISFQCVIDLVDKTDCNLNYLEFYDGHQRSDYCGQYSSKVLFSQENLAKVRILLDAHGHGKVRCITQSVTGPNPNEYENLISEEMDSSEYGVTPGIRATSCDCGRANKNVARIIFGAETRENEFPWMVDLQTNRPGPSRCGGSVITDRHVLTAAHCVMNDMGVTLEPENVTVILAEHNRAKKSGYEVYINVDEIFTHEDYAEDNTRDIGLIYTNTRMLFNAKIAPICLEPNPLPVVNNRITVMGWGLTENYHESDILLKANVRVMHSFFCDGKPHDVCVSPKDGNHCRGDSGSPLVWLDPETNRYTQVSIVSRGGFDCLATIGYSTQTAYFYQWIQDKIQQTNPSSVTCYKV